MPRIVELAPELESRLNRMAEDRQATAGGLIEEAIRQFVAREEAKAGFAEEARQSLADYRRTGLHLTGEEASAWLRNWGTDEETGAPACHG